MLCEIIKDAMLCDIQLHKCSYVNFSTWKRKMLANPYWAQANIARMLEFCILIINI